MTVSLQDDVPGRYCYPWYVSQPNFTTYEGSPFVAGRSVMAIPTSGGANRIDTGVNANGFGTRFLASAQGVWIEFRFLYSHNNPGSWPTGTGVAIAGMWASDGLQNGHTGLGITLFLWGQGTSDPYITADATKTLSGSPFIQTLSSIYMGTVPANVDQDISLMMKVDSISAASFRTKRNGTVFMDASFPALGTLAYPPASGADGCTLWGPTVTYHPAGTRYKYGGIRFVVDEAVDPSFKPCPDTSAFSMYFRGKK